VKGSAMMRNTRIFRLSACVLVLVLNACGGGGGSGQVNSGSGSTAPVSSDPVYTPGVYNSPTTYAAHCAMPRSGVDPISHQQYPDVQGSMVWENNWLRSWENSYYLWYNQLPDLNPASYSTALSYFAADKTSALTASGSLVDKFHFTYTTSQWEALSQSGASVDYGAKWEIIQSKPPRQMLVAYVEPNSPANNVNLQRGASVVKIDGIDFINASDQTSVNAINAALSPTNAGESHIFTIIDTPGSATRDVTLTATTVTSQSVMNIKTFSQGTGRLVGYFQFNDHLATAELALNNAVTQMKSAGVSDLIIDMRYNGGGYLAIASELAYMVAGPQRTNGLVFEKTVFNDKYPTTDPITGQTIVPTPFYSTTQGLSVSGGQALPALNLARVMILMGADTCSASESVINGLRGINVQVLVVGSQSCGKPYGFYPQDNCGTTYFSIEFKGVNNQGFGDYTDGFIPQNATALNDGVPVPGCAVADDFTHELGDPAESRLGTALQYLAQGASACPSPTGLTVAPILTRMERPHMIKPVWMQNRILIRSSDH